MSAPSPNSEWYCQVAGKTHGPYSTADLKRLVREGRLYPSDNIKQGREGRWLPARDVRNLFADRQPANTPDIREPAAASNRALIFTVCGVGGLLFLVSIICIVIAAGRGDPGVAPKPIDPEDAFVLADKDPFAKKLPETKPRPRGVGPLDQFGNPQDRDAGLAQDGEFVGKKIIVYGHLGGENRYVFTEQNPLWISLRKKGFDVKLHSSTVFPADLINDYDQLWIFAYNGRSMQPRDYDAVQRYVRAGKSLYLLGDNAPNFVEANELANRLFGTPLIGNYHGTQIAYIKDRAMDADMIRKFGGQFPIDDHPLLTGVNFIYEGITISHFNETDSLKVAVRASDGRPLIGVSQVKGWRVVVDCGFTRYFYDETNPKGPRSLITRVAGTLRYGENVAAYLAGKER